MSDSDRPTGVTLIAALFVITAIPSFIGTAYFIIDSLDVVFADGLGEGLLVSFWALLLGIVATLFYGVIAFATGYGLWFQKGWSRTFAIFLSIFLLFAFPVGTILGGLIIWYLRKPEVKDTFIEAFMF
jgi:uncharacterized membrane protein (DUF2068 family)